MSLTATKISFSEREIRFLKFLRDKYLSKGTMSHYVQTPMVPKEGAETAGDVKDMICKFERLKLVVWETTDSFSIKPSVLDVLHEIENPPIKNHLTEWTSWWFGVPWRAAISLIAIILPLIVQWIEMIKTVLKWILRGEST
jgi:hypothetical protein